MVLYSCEPPIFSEVPTITFKGATTNKDADTLILTITFRDGDGDLGISGTDTAADFNYLIEAQKKLDGEFKTVVLPQFTPGVQSTLNGRFPVLKPDGQPGPIEGDLDYTIGLIEPPDLTNELYIMPFDTLQFKIYILDRAGHRSNQVTSSEVVVLKR
jgi:hypothetical protein